MGRSLFQWVQFATIITVTILFLLTPILRATTLMSPFNPPSFFDFGVYYQIGEFVREGLPLYATSLDRIPRTGSRYLYPPVLSLVFVPFTYLPMQTAGYLWIALSLIGLAYAIGRLFRAYYPDRNHWTRLTAIALIAVALYYPTYIWISLGQITGILVAALCLVAALIKEEENSDQSSWWIVVLTTIPSIVKTFYAPVGAHLLRSRWRLFWATGLVSAVVVVGLVMFGINEHIQYLNVLAKGKGWSAHAEIKNWNRHTYVPFYVLGKLALPAKILLSIIIAAVAIFSRRHPNVVTEQYVYVMGVTTVTLVSPTPNLLLLNVLIPVFIILLILEYQVASPLVIIPVAAIGLVQLHLVAIRVYISSMILERFNDSLLEVIIPLAQPGLWAAVSLLCLCVFRVLQQSASKYTGTYNL
jgi:hypothetical protein